jgi:branched-chain amino acid transport system permease protein
MRFVEPGSFTPILSIFMLLYVVMGGMRSHWGVVLGASVFTLVPELSRGLKDYRGVFMGGLIIALMIFRPKGIITRDMVRMIFRMPRQNG